MALASGGRGRRGHVGHAHALRQQLPELRAEAVLSWARFRRAAQPCSPARNDEAKAVTLYATYLGVPPGAKPNVELANVTVRSVVYTEYLHLARTSDGWKIVNDLWQPTPGSVV
jgi:hypothetical protein